MSTHSMGNDGLRKPTGHTDCKRVRDLSKAISNVANDRASFFRDALRRATRRAKERSQVATLHEKKVDTMKRNLDEIKRRIEYMTKNAPVVVSSPPIKESSTPA